MRLGLALVLAILCTSFIVQTYSKDIRNDTVKNKLEKRHMESPIDTKDWSSIIKGISIYVVMDLLLHSVVLVGIQKAVERHEKDTGPYDSISIGRDAIATDNSPKKSGIKHSLNSVMSDLYNALDGRLSDIMDITSLNHKLSTWHSDSNLLVPSENAITEMIEKEALYNRLNMTATAAYESLMVDVSKNMPIHLSFIDRVSCGSLLSGDRQPLFRALFETLQLDNSLSVQEQVLKYREYIQGLVYLQTAGHMLLMKSVPYTHGKESEDSKKIASVMQHSFISRLEYQLTAATTVLSSPLLKFLFVPSGALKLAQEEAPFAAEAFSNAFAVISPDSRFALGFTNTSNMAIAANPVNSESKLYRDAFAWKFVISETNTLSMTNGYVDIPVSIFRMGGSSNDQFCVQADTGYLGLSLPLDRPGVYSTLGYYVNNLGAINLYRRTSSKGMRVFGSLTRRKKTVGKLEFFGNDTYLNYLAYNQPIAPVSFNDTACLSGWRIDPIHSNGYIMESAEDSFSNFNGTDLGDIITGPAMIFPGAKITSENKLYSAHLTKTCVLAVVLNGAANKSVTVVHKYAEMPSTRYLWTSNEVGHVGKDGNQGNCVAHFLPEGFLQIWSYHEDTFKAAPKVRFSSHVTPVRNQYGPYTLVMENTGSLSIRDSSGQVTWMTPSANTPDNDSCY